MTTSHRGSDPASSTPSAPPPLVTNPGPVPPTSSGRGARMRAAMGVTQPDLTIGRLPGYTNAPHPWRRYFARIVDLLLYVIIGTIALEIAFPGRLDGANDRLVGIAVSIAAVPIETVLIALFGTTVGKALLATRVLTAQGTYIGFGHSFSRAVNVLVRGQALGVPIVGFITQVVQYRNLVDEGVATYDRGKLWHVVHGPIGARQIAAVVVLIVILVGLVVAGSMA